MTGQLDPAERHPASQPPPFDTEDPAFDAQPAPNTTPRAMALQHTQSARARILSWALSAALHGGLLGLLAQTSATRSLAASYDELSFESTTGKSEPTTATTAEPEAPTHHEPPEPTPPAPATRVQARAARTAGAKHVVARPAPEPDSVHAPRSAAEATAVADGDELSADPAPGVAVAAAVEAAPSGASEEPLDPGPTRTPGPARVAFWLALPLLEHLTLIRPTHTLLMSVPGYRDVMRGSGIRPFSDLTLLHVQLAGLEPAQLVVAGVHFRGETPLLEAATRMASIREREPIWRGNATLRATSWIDGSGVDRGFAVHEGAFVIGARGSMPGLLGSTAPGERVAQLSRLRKRVVLRFSLEDAGHYLPSLGSCELQALYISVAAYPHAYRMSLGAEYGSANAAQHAAACLAQSEMQAPRLLAWLTMTSSASTPQGNNYQLNTEVTRGDIEALFEELGRGLRRSGRP